MARMALIPGSPEDPTTLDGTINRAMRDMRRRFREIVKRYRERLAMVPAYPVVNARYTFLLDSVSMAQLMDDMGRIVDTILLDGGDQRIWLFEAHVSVAIRKGIAQEFTNLAAQSPVYRAGRVSLDNLLRSDPVLRRASLARARVFEEMKGLSADTKSDLGRILAEGIGRGKGPLEIGREIAERTPANTARGARIARTEMTMALKRAKWDESEEAREAYNLRSMEMHLSALSPTTRDTHRARHSKLYTVAQCREWWAKDANAINCKCSTTTVLVNEEGKPLAPQIVARAKAALKKHK